MKQFVYTNRNIYYSDGMVRENGIGMLNEINGSKALVSFVCNSKTIEVDVDCLVYFEPSQTGDQYEKKVCNVCNRLLDVDMFQKNQNGKNNRVVRRPSCRDCRVIIDGANMTADEKEQMDQIKPHMIIWTCPVCKKTTVPGLTSKVVCDHDHKTGHPRSWICDSCNTGLGRFKDDIHLLENAIDYLKKNDIQ